MAHGAARSPPMAVGRKRSAAAQSRQKGLAQPAARWPQTRPPQGRLSGRHRGRRVRSQPPVRRPDRPAAAAAKCRLR
eukprot:13113641-Alexandrium_andersonii.AAC.1